MGWGDLQCLAAAFAYVSWGACLSWHDLTTRRLPDRLTLPAVPIIALLSLGDASFTGCLCGALTWSGAYAIVGVAAPGAMGGGDVKLALSLGGVTGWVSGIPGTLLAMIAAGMLTGIAGTSASSGLGMRRLEKAIPHGPSMLVACAGVVLGGPMAM